MACFGDRRDFLKTCAVAAGGASGALAGWGGGGVARAIEPIARNGKSFFKFSLAAYSYRDLLNAKPPKTKLTLDDFIADCAKMGLEGTELTSLLLSRETDAASTCATSSSFASGWGSTFPARRWAMTFAIPPGDKRDQEIKHVKQWVDYAEILGAPVIRIFSGQPHDTSEAEAHKLAVAGIEECCQYAGEHGVFLALENHGGLTTKPEGIAGAGPRREEPLVRREPGHRQFPRRGRVRRHGAVGALRDQRAGEGVGVGARRQAAARRLPPRWRRS